MEYGTVGFFLLACGAGIVLILGAVLKKMKILGLGFGGPGLKIHGLKEKSCPAPVLEGEGRIYNIFGARAF